MGLSTSASKEIVGFSDNIDSNIVVLNGAQHNFHFLEENCAIEMTFENEIDTIRDTITIASPKIMTMVFGSGL